MTTHTGNTGFTPTPEQAQVLEQLFHFTASSATDDFFILRGAAGTGKTTLVRVLADHLRQEEIAFRIAAPTARAAKIIGGKTGEPARTLHSLIYKPERLPDSPAIRLLRKENTLSERAIYIVDESSMIADQAADSQAFITEGSLLRDFIAYVKEGHPQSRVLFIGDAYQLPPVGSDFSPALQAGYLRRELNLRGQQAELSEVLRQEEGSRILQNAQQLREAMEAGSGMPQLDCAMLPHGYAAVALFVERFDPEHLGRIIFIAYTNRDVDFLNGQVRQRLGLADALLSPGDVVLLEATWMDREQTLYRGETGVVRSVRSGIEEFAGLHFAAAEVWFPNAGDEGLTIQAKVLLEALSHANGQIGWKAEKRLYSEAMKRNRRYRNSLHLADAPFLGAMRLRHAFAVTGHKAQGGEWEQVLLHPYCHANALQWRYTAVTRARRELFSWPPYRKR